MATAILETEMVFTNVPVRGTKRGVSIPHPAVKRVGVHNDMEWDGRSAPDLMKDVEPRGYYVADFTYKPVGKGGCTKTMTGITKVDPQQWQWYLTAWLEYLRESAKEWTTTHVVDRLGGSPPAPTPAPVQEPTPEPQGDCVDCGHMADSHFIATTNPNTPIAPGASCEHYDGDDFCHCSGYREYDAELDEEPSDEAECSFCGKAAEGHIFRCPNRPVEEPQKAPLDEEPPQAAQEEAEAPVAPEPVLPQPEAHGSHPDIAYDLLAVPLDDPQFLPETEPFEQLDAAWRMMQLEGKPQTVLLMGDTSTGKTEHPIIWAARRDILHVRIDCGAFGEIYDVTGPIVAKEKNGASITEWVKGKLIRAMADPRPKVIQLDEVNRISDVKAINILLPFFDISGKSYFDEAQTWMHLTPNTLIVATMNGDVRGDDIGDYNGTQPLDAAFVSRFPVGFQFRYPGVEKLMKIIRSRAPKIEADDAELLAEIATELVALHKFVPNLRELIRAARFIEDGLPMFRALKWTVGRLYKDDSTAECDWQSFRTVLTGKGVVVENN